MYIYIYFIPFLFASLFYTRKRYPRSYLIFLYFSNVLSFHSSYFSLRALYFPRTVQNFSYSHSSFFFFIRVFLYYRHEEKDTIGIIWKNNDSPTLFSHFCLWLSTGIPRTPETEQIPNAQLQMRQKSWIFWRNLWESYN